MRHWEASVDQRRPGLISFPPVTIGSLTDNVLLDIFDFCQTPLDESPWRWYALVHVCQRWRYIVFESPLRLDLRLDCDADTPVRKMLNVWPRDLPIVIWEGRSQHRKRGTNIIAALEHRDRMSAIDLNTTSALLKRLNKVLKKPYPVLTSLRLRIRSLNPANSAPVLRYTFLGGSAPLLRDLTLIGVPFPALPKFLPCCHDLVNVRLWNIPNSSYISPKAISTALSALTKLKVLYIGFESPASRPDPGNSLPSSLTRVILPALTFLMFHGASEYFEDLVARIDTPAIISVNTRFFNQLDFDIPHFLQFIGRTWIPGSFEETKFEFWIDLEYSQLIRIEFGRRDPLGGKKFLIALAVEISCHALDWQVACAAQICGKISPFLSNVERLGIMIAADQLGDTVLSDWKDYVDNPQWLEIFYAFPALQHMGIPPKLGEIIPSVLQELTGERVMEALPMLRHLYLPSSSASTQQPIQPFISSRQRSKQPVTVHLTEMD